MRAHTEKKRQLLAHWKKAPGTQAFQPHRITLDPLSNALESTVQRFFQRLIQALFREGLINPDTLPHKIQPPSELRSSVDSSGASGNVSCCR
jgi:hypothetical protein